MPTGDHTGDPVMPTGDQTGDPVMPTGGSTANPKANSAAVHIETQVQQNARQMIQSCKQQVEHNGSQELQEALIRHWEQSFPNQGMPLLRYMLLEAVKLDGQQPVQICRLVAIYAILPL